MAENTRFEVEVSVIDTTSSERAITKTYNYHLNHYKVRRNIIPSQGYNYIEIGNYDLNVIDRLQNI